jgi:hypothetical protein
VRLWQAVAISTVAACVIAGSAASTHDPEAKFAGKWTIDPAGAKPGLLKLRLVADAAGIETFRSMGVIDQRCDEPTIWYVGTFTTSNDNGPVVGCTRPRVLAPAKQAFSGWFRSTNFSGSGGSKIGKLDLPSVVEGTFQAHASALGEYTGRLNPVLMRFAGHFPGDGSKDAEDGKWAFRVDAPTDSLLHEHVPETYKVSEFLWVDHLSGSGGVRQVGDPRLDLTGKITITRDRKVGRDTHLTLEAEDDGLISINIEHTSQARTQVFSFNVRVVASNDSSCPVGRTGEFHLVQLAPRRHQIGAQHPRNLVLMRLCRAEFDPLDGWGGFQTTHPQVHFPVKVVMRGVLFD